MYPKNAATPPIVTVGQVVQISDGAVQTAGASVRVKTGTGAWGAGAGTLACDTTSGAWTYAPTQGETNDTDFHVAVYKASCLGCAVSIITSASATAGKVVLSGETHTSAVIPTVSTLTGHTPQTGDSFAIVSSGSHGNAALKTLIDVVDDYLDTEIASIKAKTDNLPTDPADQSAVEAAITAATSGLATAASLATVAGYLDTEIAAILADTNELQTDWANGGRLDLILDEILVDTGTTLQAELDGIQADTEDIQSRLPAALVSGRMDASVGAMAANTLTASALAADAVIEIQTGLATQVSVDDIPTNAELTAALGALNDFDPATDVVARVTLVDTCSVNTDMRGTNGAYTGTPPTVGQIADAVYDEAYSGHTAAGTYGKLFDTIRKSNLNVEGQVADVAATTTQFATNLTAPTTTYQHRLLVFTSGALNGLSRPIKDYTLSGGVGVLTFEASEAWPSVPQNGATFEVLLQHIHPIEEIQSGLATSVNVVSARDSVLTEVAKIPKAGETRRYTQVAANSVNKTADVSVGAPL